MNQRVPPVEGARRKGKGVGHEVEDELPRYIFTIAVRRIYRSSRTRVVVAHSSTLILSGFAEIRSHRILDPPRRSIGSVGVLTPKSGKLIVRVDSFCSPPDSEGRNEHSIISEESDK